MDKKEISLDSNTSLTKEPGSGVIQMTKYKVKVTKINEKVAGTKEFQLECPESLVWEEGSHLHIGLAGFDKEEVPNKALVRHMSIISLPKEGFVGFTTRVPGSGSEFKLALDRVKVGEEVTLFKIGSRMQLRREESSVILLSMGVGIATMRPLILTYLEESKGIPLLWNINVDAPGKHLYKDELEVQANQCYRNSWLDSKENYEKELEKAVDVANAIYYIVGSDEFLLSTITYLSKVGVSKDRIVLDKKPEKRDTFFN